MSQRLRTEAIKTLRELIANLDQYDLDESTMAIVAKAKGVLAEIPDPQSIQKRRGPAPFSSEIVASIRSEKGSLRDVAKKLNVSYEVVRKYRQQ